MANEVRVDVALDTKGAEQEAKTFKGKMASTFGEMGKIAGGIFMAEIGGALASKGVETFKNSISLARDFNEIQSKSNTIFGESADAINKWADSASTSFGQSKAEALDAAGTFGNMFTQLGIGADEAANMSMAMTELASDFASFHNADITQVIDAQSAAFRGEYDALQRFVPTINAAAVEQKALAMTGKELTKELTLQEKALAVQALMMEGAGDAMGDFDRTSGSLSNQQRILSAQWKDLQTDIGQALIPALTKIVTTINEDVVPAVRAFGEDAQKAWKEDIKPAIDDMQDAWESIKPIVVPILENISREIKRSGEVLREVVGFVSNILSGDFKGAWENAKEIVRLFIESFKDRIETAKTIVKELGPRLLELGKEAFQKLQDGFTHIWNTWIVPFVKSIPGQVKGFIGDAGKILYDIGKAIMTGLWDGLKAVWGDVSDWLGGLGDKIKLKKGPLEADKVLLLEEGKAIISGLHKGMELEWRNVEDFLTERARKVKAHAQKIAAEAKAAADAAMGGDGSGYTHAGSVGTRTASGPTGAYGVALVEDPQTGAMVMPWDVGQGYGGEGRFQPSYGGKFHTGQGQVVVSIQNYNAGTADGDLAAGDLLYALGKAGLA